MQPSARLQAIVELLEETIAGWQQRETPLPADVIVKRYIRKRRYIGSADRRYITDMVFSIFRNYGALLWHLQYCEQQLQEQQRQPAAPILAAAALLFIEQRPLGQVVEMFSGEEYAPAPLTESERQQLEIMAEREFLDALMPRWARLNYPLWLEKSLEESLKDDFVNEMQAMLQQAPLDLRVNTLKATREEVIGDLKRCGIDSVPASLSPVGIRIAKRVNIGNCHAFKEGKFEIQDEGAQLVTLLLDAQPGEVVVDYCAGAGGKSLAIAASMRNSGQIIACDINEKRLRKLMPRAKRAGVDIITPCLPGRDDNILEKFTGKAARLLLDVPCSGSGVWRRQPDARWRITEERLQQYMSLQRQVINSAMKFLAPGGVMLYVTCSLLPQENEKQVEWILSNYRKLKLVSPAKMWNKLDQVGTTTFSGDVVKITPYKACGDGFFAAMLAYH